jgi:hypothetical protein
MKARQTISILAFNFIDAQMLIEDGFLAILLSRLELEDPVLIAIHFEKVQYKKKPSKLKHWHFMWIRLCKTSRISAPLLRPV